MMQTVSIIMAYDGIPKQLQESLESLAGQRDTDGYGIDLVVIGGANDAPEIDAMLRRAKLPARSMRMVDGNRAHALNRAIGETSGDIVACTSSGTIFDRRWLESIRRCFSDHNCDAVGGRVLPLYPPERPSWAHRFKYILAGPLGYHDYGYDSKRYDPDLMASFVRRSIAVRRQSIARYGMFDTSLRFAGVMGGEDRELFREYMRKGAAVFYCGQALAYYRVRRDVMTYRYIARWYIDYGRYAARKSMRKNGVYYFGFPRWKLKLLFKNIILLTMNLFNRRGFFECWQGVFTKIGEIAEYRGFRNGERQRHNAGI